MGAIPAWAWKLLGVCLVVAGAAGFGWWHGYSGEHDALVAFQSKVAAEAQAQDQRTKEIEAEHDNQTRIVAQSYGAEFDRLNRVIAVQSARLRNPGSGSSGIVSVAPGSTQGIDGSGLQLSRACEDSGADPCEVTRDFYNNALKDALTVNGWYQFAQLQHFPVE